MLYYFQIGFDKKFVAASMGEEKAVKNIACVWRLGITLMKRRISQKVHYLSMHFLPNLT